MNRVCKCRTRNCTKRVFAKENRHCSQACRNKEDFCVNRRFELSESQAAEMDNASLNPASGAFAAIQQHMIDTLAVIVERFPVPPVAPTVALGSQSDMLGSEIKYVGTEDESITEWF